MEEEPLTQLQVQKARSYFRYFDKYDWSVTKTGLHNSILFRVDSNEHPLLFEREDTNSYMRLKPIYKHDIEHRSNITENYEWSDEDFNRRRRKTSEINFEVMSLLNGANNLTLVEYVSKKPLASFYIKGTEKAVGIFRRCLQSGGKL